MALTVEDWANKPKATQPANKAQLAQVRRYQAGPPSRLDLGGSSDEVTIDIARVMILADVNTLANDHLEQATTVEGQSLFEQFQELKFQWLEATMFSSHGLDMILDENYQRIIGLGPDVLPLLIQELRECPNHWFWALRAVTGEDPVREESRGDFDLMVQDWLEWANERGI